MSSVTVAAPRRAFLRAVALVGSALLIPRALRAASRILPAHPTPRPGITGAHVLTAAQLTTVPQLVELFDGVRAIPAIADGIRCHCGCAELPGFYSLLSCYEGDGMAKICPICQGEGRVTIRLHKQGKSLDEIRRALDAQFA